MTFFDVGSPQPLLVPVNYLLTVVAVPSVILFAVLILLKSKEKETAAKEPAA